MVCLKSKREKQEPFFLCHILFKCSYINLYILLIAFNFSCVLIIVRPNIITLSHSNDEIYVSYVRGCSLALNLQSITHKSQKYSQIQKQTHRSGTHFICAGL